MIVVLPVLDAARARSCVASMHPELQRALFVIDQTDRGLRNMPGELHRPPPHTHERDYLPRRNIGVARSMNLGVTRMRERGDDLLLWVSTSMLFGPDGGMRLVEAAASDELGVVGMPCQWHAVALHAAAFDLAGLWDEGFFPAYYEDTEWRYRLALASGRPALPTVEVGGEARDGRGYDRLLAVNPGRTVVNFDAHQGYYASKWGGCPPDSERFTHPFDDPSLPLDWWAPASREDLIERYGLGL